MIKSAIIAIGFLLFSLVHFDSIGQTALVKGDAIQNLPIKKLLNSASPLISAGSFADQLTIIDFFGTWCAPCLRALPHLTALKENFKNELLIVLVSNETETQLTKFIKARSDFPFPVIVDIDNDWNGAFQPPALPYTVVVKGGMVLAVTEAASITGEAIRQWLNKTDLAEPLSEKKNQKTESKPSTVNTFQKSKNEVVKLSQEYIYAARTDASLTLITQNLAFISPDSLKKKLVLDNEKKAFWINVYNGYTQAALKENAGQYKNRNAFFKNKSINVADEIFSLDDIEHGILRHSKVKWNLGLWNKLFPSAKEKALRVKKLDYRIHFALNCGAKSCPPIAFYNDQTLDAQLELATKVYLSSETVYDSTSNTIGLPKLMNWFSADFGGRKGMIKILRHHGIIAPNAKPKIKFNDYDWTLTLNNYTK